MFSLFLKKSDGGFNKAVKPLPANEYITQFLEFYFYRIHFQTHYLEAFTLFSGILVYIPLRVTMRGLFPCADPKYFQRGEGRSER